jgi:outer membrane protein assembly factor BamB
MAACSAETQVHDAESMFRGGVEHSGVYDGGGIDGFAGVRWAFRTEGAVRASPTVAGDAVFIGSTDGHLYALDRDRGGELWRFDAGSSINATAAVAGDLVFFGDRAGVLRALDRADGRLVWAFATGEDMPLPWGNEGWDYYTSSPAVAGGVVLFGSGDGILYAVDARSGRERWRYATEGVIRSSPAVADGVVYVGSADGSLHAVDLPTGEGRWKYDTEGHGLVSADFGFDRRSIQSSPAVVSGSVVFGARDGYLYAVDQATGALRWRFDHQVSWCITSPAVHDGVVFAGSSDGLFAHAVDLGTGEELWRTTTGSRVFASPALSGETVLVGDHGGTLFALDRSSGIERWQFRTGAPIQSSPVVHEGVVFVGSDDGFVYALEGTTGPSLHRAVFWDADMQPVYAGHEELRDHLEGAGYQVLDAASLADFMSTRIADQERSVVVFAMGDVPTTVAPVAADTVLFRRYLDAGGRILWLGYPPLSLARDPETGMITAVDMDRTRAVVSVDHSRATFDEYATWPTAEGRGAGLAGTWIDILGVAPADVDEVLALDERNRATAWMKSYGVSGAGGFVKLWGRADEAWQDLGAVRRLAEGVPH